MPLFQSRGGIPYLVSETTSIAAVQQWEWKGGIANYLWFKNLGAGDIVLSFTEDDAKAGKGITIASGDVWEGPAETAQIFTKSAAAQAFQAVAFIRRG